MPARAAKELRSLLLPAGLILAGTLLAGLGSRQFDLALHYLGVNVAALTFFLGTPLVAAWSLGSEFQQRTLVLLLTQPVSRSRVWLEKWGALAFVVALLLAIQFAALRVGPFEPEYSSAARYLWVAAMLCSTPLWTLVARSTIGGLTFSVAAAALLELSISFVVHWFADPAAPRRMFEQTPALTTLRIVYCAGTFALGWWMFSRLQAGALEHGRGATAAAGGRSTAWVRYDPNHLLRNLLIAEMRVHRPTWLVAIGFAACWIAAMMVGAVAGIDNNALESVFAALMGMYFPVAIVLAGTLSIAEDVTLGIHPWRLTLPLSTRAQWLVKLAFSLLAAAIVVVIIPAGMWKLASMVFAPELPARPPFAQPQALGLIAALVVLCFWAAALIGHTVRAAVVAALLLVAFVLCWRLGDRLAWRLEILDPILTSMIVRWQLPPDYFTAPPGRTMERLFGIALPVVLSGLAMLQSLRAFRRARSGARAIASQLAVMAAAMFVLSIGFMHYTAAAGRQAQSAPAVELSTAARSALQALPADRERPLTLEELERTGVLSPRTRAWIHGSTMTVVLGRAHRGGSIAEVRVQFPGSRNYRFFVRVVDPPPAAAR